MQAYLERKTFENPKRPGIHCRRKKELTNEGQHISLYSRQIKLWAPTRNSHNKKSAE